MASQSSHKPLFGTPSFPDSGLNLAYYRQLPGFPIFRHFGIGVYGSKKRLFKTFDVFNMHSDAPLYNLIVGCRYSEIVESMQMFTKLFKRNIGERRELRLKAHMVVTVYTCAIEAWIGLTGPTEECSCPFSKLTTSA